MKSGGLIAIIVIAVLLLGVGGCLVGNYNKLVSADQGVKNRWAEVDNQLQRRGDLIGNLVETVKGVASQEQAVFGQIASARAALGGAHTPEQGIAAGQQMDNALSRLLVVVENYPQLQSNAQFSDLMASLEGTENRLSVARMRYNDEAKGYNILVQQFPMNLFAGMFGYKPATYYPVPDAAKALPKVDFSGIKPGAAPVPAGK
jgi:LemA protein